MFWKTEIASTFDIIGDVKGNTYFEGKSALCLQRFSRTLILLFTMQLVSTLSVTYMNDGWASRQVDLAVLPDQTSLDVQVQPARG